MKRDLLQQLVKWRHDPLRMPLILRGARQVGKSWLVQNFGQLFPSYVEINFDLEQEACEFFKTQSNLEAVLDKIQLYKGQKIIPNQTLLFLDEIQECPAAVKLLRYFKEKMPELHVIAAGSLLDFLLEEIGAPVGRVQFLYLKPLSFGEYLTALGREDLRQFIVSKQQDSTLHTLLLDHLQHYMWLGGLPAVVDAWINFHDAVKCQSLQDRIITAYKQDFLKYAKKNQIQNLEKVFISIPRQLGTKFKFSHVDDSIKAISLKTSLDLLVKAGVAYYCFHSDAQGFPLAAQKNEKSFKIFFFDIGLAQRLLNLDLSAWIKEKLNVTYLGGIAEQLAAQEYLSYSNPEIPSELYYWHRQEKNSNAEVDFVFTRGSEIVPTEIKAGVKGGMKSLHAFLAAHPRSTYGLKISQALNKSTAQLEELALYAIEGWLSTN